MTWVWVKLFSGLLFVLVPGFTFKDNYKKHRYLTIIALTVGIALLVLSIEPLYNAAHYKRLTYELINEANDFRHVSNHLSIGCNELYLDLEDGTLNGIKPTDSQSVIKKYLPCYTGATREGNVANYGGGVFYLDHDFYIYTAKDFIQIRGSFSGKVSGNMLNNSYDEIIAKYGQPTIKNRLMYATKYGCMYFYEDEISVHYTSCKQADSIF